MRTLFLLLLFVTATPSFACVDTVLLDPLELFVDQRAEAAVSGLCGTSAVPFQPLVRLEGTTVTIDFAQESVGLAVPTSWGERVRLPSLFPGQYDAVVRINGQEVTRRTFLVRDRPFRLRPALGEPGQKVLIEGLPVDKPCLLIHCGFFDVFFGGVPAVAIEEIGDQRLLVTVPPGSGRVDVRVDLHSADSATLPGGFRYGEGLDDSWERVLFPVNFVGPGAHGSEWITDIRLRNDAPVDIETVPTFWFDRDSPVLPLPVPFIPAGARASFPNRQRDGGEFLHVPRDLESSLAYAAHIVDLSRGTTDLGAEMPLVRAEDTAHTIRLLEVPVEDRYRARLRVYDFDPVNGRQAIVLLKDAEGALITTRELTLTGVPACVTTPCLAGPPAFNVLDLDQILELDGHDFVDVTVASRTREGRIWAFVSVTNNETQAVTLYTPQHRTRAQ